MIALGYAIAAAETGFSAAHLLMGVIMSSRPEITGLQFLRGYCACFVVLDHASGMAEFPKYLGREFASGMLLNGRVGVDIFFVISGFIIAITSLDAENRPAIARADFFIKRFARIVPLMWVAIASYAALRILATSTEFEPWAYIRAATLWPSGDVAPNVIWTLRHEMLFYGMFALTFLKGRSLRLGLWAWILVSIFSNMAGIGGTNDFVSILLSPVNVEFGAGVVAGLLWLRGQSKPVHVPIHPALLLLCGALLVVVASASLPFEWRTIGNTLITAPLAGALVYLAARLACPPGAITQVARFLGNATFAIYLFHLHAVSAALIVVTRVYRDCPLPVAIVFVSGCGILAGIVVHLLLEKRLIRWVSGMFKAVRRPKVQGGNADGAALAGERQPEPA